MRLFKKKGSKYLKKKPVNIKRNKSIKTQIALTISLVLFISIAVTGALNYNFERLDTIESAKKENYDMATAVSRQVDMYIDTSLSSLTTVDSAISFNDLEPEDKNLMLIRMLNKNKQFMSLFVTDNKGNIDATTNVRRDSGKNYGKEEWFNKVIKGETHISNASIDPTTNLPKATIMVPLKDFGGNVIGVLGADFKLDQIYELIKDIKVGATGFAYIVDGEGKMLAHRDFNEMVMNQYDGKQIKGVSNLLTDGNGSDRYINANGKDVIGGYHKSELTNWGFVVEREYKEAMMEASNAFWRTILISIGVTLFGIVVAMIFASKISKPILAMVSATNSIRDGNLTEKINTNSKSEIGKLQTGLNEMTESLRNLIRSINNTSEELSASSKHLEESAIVSSQASTEISAIIGEVAQNTENQITSVDKTSTTINEMITGIKDIASHSTTILKSSNHAASLAEGGAKEINEIVETMEEINDTSIKSNDLIKNLNSHITEISNIVAFIRGISDQTNLLALNASIEAARAGEHGRGFTVVAEEVKKLAEESSKASMNIEELINNIKVESNYIVNSMENSMQKVQRGTEVINSTTTSFREITKETQRVAVEIENFASAIEQLSNGMNIVESVVEEVVGISNVTASGTQSVLASVEEQDAAIHNVTESVQRLREMSDELGEVVKQFKL